MTCKIVVAAIISACSAWTAAAQVVRGTILDSVALRPIVGAVVLALDSAGGTRARTISDRLGHYELSLGPAALRLRALRIGFRPRELPTPTITDSTTTIDIVLSRLPTLLEPVRIVSGAQCPKRSSDETVFGLLDQARAGLLAMVVARETSPARIVRLSFKRAIDGTSERIRSQEVRIDSTDHPGPSFRAARSAAEFVQLGFADPPRSFFAPDAEILLDDSFREGYCFSIAHADQSRPGEIGLAFAPATRRVGRVDIDGTLWIDTVARELRDVRFRYVGLDRSIDAASPGGHIEFRTLGNGIVLIDRWFLRLAAMTAETVFVRGRERVRPGQLVAEESGGEVARASWPDGFTWHASLGTFRGYAVDANGNFARGVTIGLAETDYRATTNDRGAFEIESLLPGPYVATASGFTVDALGLSLQTSLAFTAYRDNALDITLPVQTVDHFTETQCRAGADPEATVVEPGSPWLLGGVFGRDGKAMSGVIVSLSRQNAEGAWAPFADRVRTGGNGLFAFCSRLPRGKHVQVEVRDGGRLLQTARVEVGEPATVSVIRVEIPHS